MGDLDTFLVHHLEILEAEPTPRQDAKQANAWSALSQRTLQLQALGWEDYHSPTCRRCDEYFQEFGSIGAPEVDDVSLRVVECMRMDEDDTCCLVLP